MSAPQKDIQAILLKERNRRRRPGDVPYPLTDTPPPDMLDYEYWDHLFLQSCFKGLTLSQFETPPAMVLDLGCGTGTWALDAARQWPSSQVIGFDRLNIQPRLDGSEIYRDLVNRLTWKQGNFLDNLPFPSGYFDFVRIARLGLAVPEDEWQFVLEEISRVMKPGAVLEIIEEDLIFPYCQSARSRPERPRPTPLSVIDLPIPESLSSDNVSSRTSLNTLSSINTLSSSTLWSALDETPDGTLSKKNNLSLFPESPTSYFNSSRFSPKSPLSLRSQSSFTSRGSTPTTPSVPSLLPSQDSPSYNTYTTHPQDHSKLKAAWDAMLSHRFLAPRVVTVLLFYLSSCFVDVKSHPSLHISLPPNSGVTPVTEAQKRVYEASATFDPDQQFGLQRTTEGRRSDDESQPPISPTSASRRQPTWAPMHLAKTVKTVQACKEAIYVEYEKLHTADLPPVALTSAKDGRRMIVSSAKSSTREAFEREWLNWENDMADRIGMRDRIISQLHWPEPPGERPDWRVWRSNVKLLEGTQHTGDLCRTLRGFIARKS